MRLDAGARRTRDGFVATAGRYAVEVRLDGEDEVRAETAAAYERTDRETLRGDPIGIVIEGSGATIVSPADGTRR